MIYLLPVTVGSVLAGTVGICISSLVAKDPAITRFTLQTGLLGVAMALLFVALMMFSTSLPLAAGLGFLAALTIVASTAVQLIGLPHR